MTPITLELEAANLLVESKIKNLNTFLGVDCITVSNFFKVLAIANQVRDSINYRNSIIDEADNKEF